MLRVGRVGMFAIWFVLEVGSPPVHQLPIRRTKIHELISTIFWTGTLWSRGLMSVSWPARLPAYIGVVGHRSLFFFFLLLFLGHMHSSHPAFGTHMLCTNRRALGLGCVFWGSFRRSLPRLVHNLWNNPPEVQFLGGQCGFPYCNILPYISHEVNESQRLIALNSSLGTMRGAVKQTGRETRS